MEKRQKEEKRPLKTFLSRVSQKRSDSGGRFGLLLDLVAVAVGFLFGGCHLLFGAYPLGLSLVAALPSSVWFALAGAVAGSLTLGRDGVVFALICVLCVFLRVVISGQDKRRGTFSESILLRVSSAMIGGFVLAVYEILLRGFSLNTVLFGLCMTLMPVVLIPLLSGLFSTRISARELLLGGDVALFSGKSSGKRGFELIALRISAVAFIFFISLSLGRYRIFGVDTSLIFATASAIFLAKRFGALYGAVGGFAASVGITPLYSVAFMLFGVVSGALLQFGSLVALFLAGGALSLFSVYAGGVTGLLSVLPECLIGSLLTYPLLKRLTGENIGDGAPDVKRLASDMVGTMALSYRLNMRQPDDSLPVSIAELSSLTEQLLGKGAWLGAAELGLISGLMRDAKDYSLGQREIDEELTDRLEEVFLDFDFKEGVVRAFGRREKYILAAYEDESGERITSPALRKKIEEISQAKFKEPRYYRRGSMVLMELQQSAMFRVECERVTLAGESGEVSGDSVEIFDADDGRIFAVISDGMGSGTQARHASDFAVKFLFSMLKTHSDTAKLVYLLNAILQKTAEECPVTLDLFSLDTHSGEGSFCKAGAVCSYIKRGDSLFRIKSETMPLGVLSSVEAETVGAEIEAGDIIVLISDGVSGVCDDAPWLLERLHRGAPTLKEYADAILEGARLNNHPRDDMSVAVVKILPI